MSPSSEDIRPGPTAPNRLDLTEIVDYFEQVARAMKEPPILIGHCFGGLVVQMLMDRGIGAAGVVLSSVPPKGVLRWSFTTLRANWSVLRNPRNLRKSVKLTYRQFDKAFCGAMPQTAAQTAFARYAAPSCGLPIFQAATGNFPFSNKTRINYRNPRRAPLLLVAASKDRQVPPSVVRANFSKYARSRAKTEYKEFKHRSHLLIAQEGWEDVARFSLSWALSKTGNGDLFGLAPTDHSQGLHHEIMAPSRLRHWTPREEQPPRQAPLATSYA